MWEQVGFYCMFLLRNMDSNGIKNVSSEGLKINLTMSSYIFPDN